ncbi:hypothetical protein ABW21_db0204356 [Orbilia brochopaga]|nr:hypothetical protein ABW21_db0204356 [Drechslerella brochopaga]
MPCSLEHPLSIEDVNLDRLFRHRPTNLPKGYLDAYVFVIRIGQHYVPCIPSKSLPPTICLHLQRKLAPKPGDSGKVRLPDVTIIGWRWIVVDSADASINFAAIGLNVPGVATYNPSLDRLGNPLPPPAYTEMMNPDASSPETGEKPKCGGTTYVNLKVTTSGNGNPRIADPKCRRVQQRYLIEFLKHRRRLKMSFEEFKHSD